MTALAVLSHALRTTLVFALVAILAFGSLARPVSAATGDHHALAETVEGDRIPSAGMADDCPVTADMASHEMDDGSCCVGTGATILGVIPVIDAPVSRVMDLDPFDHPVSARSRNVEFLRPPSLTI